MDLLSYRFRVYLRLLRTAWNKPPAGPVASAIFAGVLNLGVTGGPDEIAMEIADIGEGHCRARHTARE